VTLVLTLLACLCVFVTGGLVGWSMGREYGYDKGHRDGWEQHAAYTKTNTHKEMRRRSS